MESRFPTILVILREAMNLLCHYRNRMARRAKSQEVGEKNPFHRVQDDCAVLTGELLGCKKQSLVPLTLPGELIRSHLEEMEHEGMVLEFGGLGSLRPTSYSFDEDLGSLQLHYSFIPVDKSKKAIEYAVFELARFDSETIKAFKAGSSNSKKAAAYVNHLLILSFYGNFGAKFGMPGSEKHRLKEDVFIHYEFPFPGLFDLLKERPDEVLHFDSRSYSYTSSEGWQEPPFFDHIRPVPKLTKPPKSLDSMFHSRPPAEVGEGYWEVQELLKQKEQDFYEGVQDYRDQYAVLLAFCKLASRVDHQSLQDCFQSYLGLIPPELLNGAWDRWALGLPKDKERLPGQVAFLDLLRKQPSKFMQDLIQSQHQAEHIQYLFDGEEEDVSE